MAPLSFGEAESVIKIVTTPVGGQGTVAAGVDGATALVYQTQFSGYMAGPWSLDDSTVCPKGTGGFGDQTSLYLIKGDGTDELDSYTVCWSIACEEQRSLGNVCCTTAECDANPNPPSGWRRCENICYPSEQQGSGPNGEYHVTTALWDGGATPNDGSCPGTGNVIPGTICTFETSATGLVCGTCPLNKLLLPAGMDLWVTASAEDIDDYWMAIGSEPFLNSSPGSLDFYVDSDIDACFDTWECTNFNFQGFCGKTEFGNEVCDWMWVPEIRANAQVAVKLVPVPPPPDSKWAATSTYTIEAKGDKGDTAVLSKGGQPVWFELHMTNFDPKGEGIQIGAFATRIDGSGYTSGHVGTVTPWAVDCANDVTCVDQLGTLSGLASRCGPAGFPPDVCEYALINTGKSDFVLQGGFTAIDVQTPNVGLKAATTSPQSEFLGAGEQYYLASIVFFVSENAKGQFTVDLLDFPETQVVQVVDGEKEPIPLVGIVPGHVRVQTGQCCFDLESSSPGCIDSVTLNECENQPGVVDFTPDATCDDPCLTCGDNLVNTPLEECDGADDSACPGRCRSDCTCEPLPEPVPTVSAWGVSILTLLLLTGSRIYFGRRMRVA